MTTTNAVPLSPNPVKRPPKVQASLGHRLSTTLWQRLVLSLMTGATAPMRRLPRSAALRFGTSLGSMGYTFALPARKKALKNLRLAYRDELNTEDQNRLTRRVFQHFGRSVVEFLRAPMLSPVQVAGMITCEGWEHVEAARAAGQGILLVTGHIGNWELLGRWIARVKELPLAVVARDPRNEALGAYMRTMRESAGFAVFSKGFSASGLLKALKRGEVILMLPDQNSGDVFVPFFGVPAGTVAGPASLALHTGSALLPVFCVAEGDGYKIICQPAIPTVSTGNKEADVARIMTATNAALEAMIRQYPDQWLWLHNRWKSAFEEKNRARAFPNGLPSNLD